MTLVSQFVGSAVPVPIRLSKPVKMLTIRRLSSVSLTLAGLDAGLPEIISMEITHPSRKRAEGATDFPLSMLAMWGQYLQGPIIERELAAGGEGGLQYQTEVHYFLNQSSSIEVTSEDQFFANIKGQVPGATYEVYAPETPIMMPNQTKFYNYEQVRILGSDREKRIAVADCVGMFIPNAPDAITEVRITYDLGGGQTKECVYTIRELLSQAQQANPVVAALTRINGFQSAAFTQDANYILLSLNFVPTVEIHTVIGQEVDYALVKVIDRNDLG